MSSKQEKLSAIVDQIGPLLNQAIQDCMNKLNLPELDNQTAFTALQAAHQAVSHHVGLLEAMMETAAPEHRDRFLDQRESMILDGYEHYKHHAREHQKGQTTH